MSSSAERIAWLESGRSLAAATLIQRSGSAPFEPGATMLIDAESAVLGSVSGGCVEMALVEEARRVLSGGEPRLLSYGISDELAGEVGLSCGGTIEVLVHALGGSSRTAMAAALRAEQEGRPVVLATRLDGPSAGARLFLDREQALGTLAGGADLDRRAQRDGEPMLDLGGEGIRELPLEGECGDLGTRPARVHLRSHVARPKLVLFGAVDFSLALAELGAAVGFEAILCEARRAFAESARPAGGVEVFRGWPEEFYADRELGARDAVLAMTHDPKFDEPALVGTLDTPAAYIGAIGSRKTNEDRRKRLAEAGMSDEQIARMRAPIGLDIGAATPEEMAISILGEIIALRRGRTGGSLTTATGHIRGER